ncbi:MAG: cytochrome c oxidase assembly protein [Gammaproteobacteria bacterium]
MTLLSLSAGTAQAHGGVEDADPARFPELLAGLLPIGLWAAYYIGSRKVSPKNGRRLIFQGTSLITVLIAFVPLDIWIGNGAAMHMIQHMLIIVLITPLYVLARPLPQWLAASGRRGVRLWKPLLRLGRLQIVTSCLQAIVIWFWHAPKLYNLALTSPWWHLLEHGSFAFSSGLFWWSVLGRPAGGGIPALLFTLMHTGMLGALLTFAQIPLYGDLNDLQDQQMAGLIMWVPGSLPYLIAGGWCSLRWFQRKVRY